MAISTTDVYIRASDGWVLVATNPAYLSIASDSGQPWWVAITPGGAPAAGTIGFPMGKGGEDIKRTPFETMGFTGQCYVRVGNASNPGGNNLNEMPGAAHQQIRFSVLYFDAAGVVIGGTPIPTIIQSLQGVQASNPTYICINYGNPSYATPTDMLSLVNPAGSGKILQPLFFGMGINSTAANPITLKQYKRAALNTAGTFTAPGIAKMDSNDGVPVGIVKCWTSAPTINDAAATLFGQQGPTNTALLTAAPVTLASFWGGAGVVTQLTQTGEPITIRPGEELVLNNSGAALPAGFVFNTDIFWSEK